MKRTGILTIVILMLTVVGLFGACSPAGQNAAPLEKPSESAASESSPYTKPSGTAQPTEDIQTTAPVSSPAPSPLGSSEAGFDFAEETYSNGTVTIRYPQIIGMPDTAAQEKLNKIIAAAALRDKDVLESGTEYELNYKVTFNRPSVISMYFDGYSYVPGAAYPNQFLYTVTIDTEKQEAMELPQLVSISEGFVEALFNGKYSSMAYEMTDEHRTAIKDNLTDLGIEFWVIELRKTDTGFYGPSSYLTEDALVISVSVPHVMGDHVEISLTFKDLLGYQTDNLIWKQIEN